MPRALLLTYHFPPSAASGSFRLLGFAQHLPALGWGVSVVAPPSLPWESVDERLLGQVPAATRLHHVPYPRSRLVKPFRALSPYGVWLPPALAACRRVCHREAPDVLLTSGPPHCVHLLGLLLKWQYRIPWVADFRDPWVATAGGGGWCSPWAGHWEKAVLRRADAVVANAPFACQSLQRAYPSCANKIVSVPNGYDPERFAGVAGGNCSDRPTIVHTGTIYAGRDARPVLDALRELIGAGRLPPCKLVFVGRFDEGGIDLRAEVNRRGLDPVVELLGPLPYEAALRSMAGAAVLLLLDSPGRRIGVPAKLYEYLGAGRPVLALAEVGGDVAAVLRESGVVHRLAPPADRERIAGALLELLTEIRAGRSAPPAPERLARFTRAGVAGQLAEVMGRCLAGRGRSAAQVC